MAVVPRVQSTVKRGPCSTRKGGEWIGPPPTHLPTYAITAHGNNLCRLGHITDCSVTGWEQHLLTRFLPPPLIQVHLETANDERLSSPTQCTMSGSPCYTLNAEGLTRPRQDAVPAKLPVAAGRVNKGQVKSGTEGEESCRGDTCVVRGE